MLGEFSYSNYLALAKIEHDLVGINLNNPSNVVFVGGGPMPLSPICLCLVHLAVKEGLLDELNAYLSKQKCAGGTGGTNELLELLHLFNPDKLTNSLHIISVERDEASAKKSNSLIRSLRLDKTITVQHAEGKDIIIPPRFNIFFIASMVIGKEEVIGNIIRQVPQGAEVYFLIRGVDRANLRAVLYEPIDSLLFELENKYPSLQKHASYVPPPGSPLINSMHVYKYRNMS